MFLIPQEYAVERGGPRKHKAIELTEDEIKFLKDEVLKKECMCDIKGSCQECLGHLTNIDQDFDTLDIEPNYKVIEPKTIVVSSKKAQFFRKKHTEFLGVEIGNGKVKLQPHIAKRALEFNIIAVQDLQRFLGLVNYARPFIKDLRKLVGPLYSKLTLTRHEGFNLEDKKQIDKVKDAIRVIPDLRLPLDSEYLIVETDGCELGWGAVLKCKPNKYSPKIEEKICRYSSGQYKKKGLTSAIDQEILAVNYGLDSFRLFILSRPEITVRADCEAIVKFFSNKNRKRISQRRWLAFRDGIVKSNYHIVFEHIKGSDNNTTTITTKPYSQEIWDRLHEPI